MIKNDFCVFVFVVKSFFEKYGGNIQLIILKSSPGDSLSIHSEEKAFIRDWKCDEYITNGNNILKGGENVHQALIKLGNS